MGIFLLMDDTSFKEFNVIKRGNWLYMNRIVNELNSDVIEIAMKRLKSSKVILSELSLSEVELLVYSSIKECWKNKLDLYEK